MAKTTKTMMKDVRVFVPITRVDKAERIVEGYAFVNPEVGDGINLTRKAMEAATPDYMQWGAVREMHRNSAAGTATAPGCGIEWDDKGAYIRAKIVDDEAWKKVEEGVYKGFSVGVRPRVMRGKDVEVCTWIENSLVDRPADPDCPISLFRSEGIEGDESEVDVITEDEAPAFHRASFAEYQASREPSERRYLAISWLSSSLWDIENAGEDADRSALAAKTCDEFKDYIVQLVASGAATRNELPDLSGMVDTLKRAEMEGDLLTRLDAAVKEASDSKAEVTRMEGLYAAASSRVKELEDMPVTSGKPVVRFTEGIDRTYLSDLANEGADKGEASAVRSEMEQILDALKSEKDEGKRQSGIVRLQVLKTQLRELE